MKNQSEINQNIRQEIEFRMEMPTDYHHLEFYAVYKTENELVAILELREERATRVNTEGNSTLQTIIARPVSVDVPDTNQMLPIKFCLFYRGAYEHKWSLFDNPNHEFIQLNAIYAPESFIDKLSSQSLCLYHALGENKPSLTHGDDRLSIYSDDGSDDIMYLGSDDENNDEYKKRWDGPVQSDTLEQLSPDNPPRFVWGQSYRPGEISTQINTTSGVMLDNNEERSVFIDDIQPIKNSTFNTKGISKTYHEPVIHLVKLTTEEELATLQNYDEQRKLSALNQFSTFAAKKEAPKFEMGKGYYPEHLKAPMRAENLKDSESEINLFKGNPGTKYPFSDSDDEFDSAKLHLTQQQHAKIQRTRINPLHTNQEHLGESFIITLHYPVSSISIILDKIIRETNVIKIEALPACEALCPDSCSYTVVTALRKDEIPTFMEYLNNKYPIERSHYEEQENNMLSCKG